LNKNIQEWCYFIDKYHWDNSDDLQFNKIVNIWKEYNWDKFIYYLSDYSDWTYLHSKPLSYLLNEKKDFQKTNKNIWDKRYKILWQIPTHTIILNYIDKNVGLWNIHKNNITYIEYYYRDIIVDIKEIIDLDINVIQKIVDFLLEIKR